MNPYLYGLFTLLVLYVLSCAFTKSLSPFALARGHNTELSTSLLQFWIFTLVTVFAYVVVFSARIIATGLDKPFPSAPDIPINLLVLMGFSVVTVSGSKGITVSYLQENKTSKDDMSNLVKNRDGDTDLTKVQMLIWTLIAAVVYVVKVIRFVEAQEFIATELMLPDIDGSLLVLMGVSQGGYIGGKLVGKTLPLPVIEDILPKKASTGETVSILGINFGKDDKNNALIIKTQDKELVLPSTAILEWTDTKINFTVPSDFTPADKKKVITGKVSIRSSAKTSEEKTLDIYLNPKDGSGQ